ncbi:MAG TPA: hypothetical protein VMZ04_02455 [Anaerolineae bacterium]|nr:hypothetical protein [Anaerolineae bacterium]
MRNKKAKQLRKQAYSGKFIRGRTQYYIENGRTLRIRPDDPRRYYQLMKRGVTARKSRLVFV